MLNYMGADLRRILSKKLLYLLCLAGIAVCVVVFVAAGATSPERILAEAGTICTLAGIFGGIYLFSVVYTDDLTAKTLPGLVGLGIKRPVLIMAKLILYTVLVALMFLALIMVFVLASAGSPVSAQTQAMLAKVLLSNLFTTVGYGAVASVVVYGTQKAAVSLVAFILLVTNIVGWLIRELAGKIVPPIKDCLLTALVEKLTAHPNIATAWPYLLYVALFVAISLVVFTKKELEF